jgi:hypothetical protein
MNFLWVLHRELPRWKLASGTRISEAKIALHQMYQAIPQFHVIAK